ncbi:MAG TPA: rod shape-determining protein MreD [Pseudogracilibacillus sp.]|nr:rod shape-determining protein MreD [Pseudogracilibacillus sp.]
MRQLFFFLILFILLVSEGVAIDLLPDILTSKSTLIVPHWIFVFLFLIVLFYDRQDTFFAIGYGVVFGLFIDVAYVGVLGVYMFVYPLTLYIMQLLKGMLQTNIYITILMTVIGITMIETLLYFIYTFIGTIDTTWSYFAIYRLLPTVLANLILFIPLYFICMDWLMKWSNERFDK